MPFLNLLLKVINLNIFFLMLTAITIALATVAASIAAGDVTGNTKSATDITTFTAITY